MKPQDTQKNINVIEKTTSGLKKKIIQAGLIGIMGTLGVAAFKKIFLSINKNGGPGTKRSIWTQRFKEEKKSELELKKQSSKDKKSNEKTSQKEKAGQRVEQKPETHAKLEGLPNFWSWHPFPRPRICTKYIQVL